MVDWSRCPPPGDWHGWRERLAKGEPYRIAYSEIKEIRVATESPPGILTWTPSEKTVLSEEVGHKITSVTMEDGGAPPLAFIAFSCALARLIQLFSLDCIPGMCIECDQLAFCAAESAEGIEEVLT
jgi:hypothetical protein